MNVTIYSPRAVGTGPNSLRKIKRTYCDAAMTVEERVRHVGWNVTESDCHEWCGALNSAGYPKICVKNETVYVHRHRLEQKLGRALAPGRFACHTCDNPKCINADHLFDGSAADNNRDAKAKGRSSGGAQGGARFLTDDVFDSLFEMRSQGVSVTKIAQELNISVSYVYALTSGRSPRPTARLSSNRENLRSVK